MIALRSHTSVAGHFARPKKACRLLPRSHSTGSGEAWAYKTPVFQGQLTDSFLARAPEKQSLKLEEDPDSGSAINATANNTAGPGSLALVELMHWVLFLTAIYVSFKLFAAAAAAHEAFTAHTFMRCAFGLVQVSIAKTGRWLTACLLRRTLPVFVCLVYAPMLS